MRPRKWILLLLFFIFVFSLLFWQAKERLEKNRSLEKIVRYAISSAIKGKCNVERISIGFFSFYLKEVSIVLPSDLITIKIKEIKSGLSIVKLLKSKGDITRSISSIVFIKPHIFITLKKPQSFSKDSLYLPTNLFDNSKDVPASPVQEIIIREGMVGFLAQRDDTLLIAEKLSGRMNSSTEEISLALDGRLGSIRKNFYIDIFFSLLKDSTNFSIRLKNASLNKHIVFNKNRISSGIIDGEIRGSLLGSNFPEGIDIKGWLKLQKGSGVVVFKSNDLMIPFSSVEADIVFKGKEYELKEARVSLRGMTVLAKGNYTLLPFSKAGLILECERIFPDSLYGIIPDSVMNLVKGAMKVSASLLWSKESGFNISFSAINGKVKDIPIDRIKIKGKIVKEVFSAESIEVKTPFFRGQINGKFYFAKSEKRCDLKFIVKADSFPDKYNLKGDVIVKGNITNPFNQLAPLGEATIFTKNILYQNLSIGSPSFSIIFRKEQCVFTTLPSDTMQDILFEGTIDSLLSSSPNLTFTANIGSKTIKNYFERSNKIPFIDSIQLSINGKGWLQKFDVSVLLKVKGKEWGGNIDGKLFRDLNSKVFFKWKAVTNNFRFKNYPLLIKAEGRFLDSIFTIDNISDGKGITGKFNIYVFHTPPHIEGYLEYHKDLSEYLEILKDNNIPLEKGRIRGRSIINGTMNYISTKASVKIEEAGNDFIDGLYSNVYLESNGKDITLLPTVIRLDTT
ncbi:MAG: hypothetical protein N2053_09710, partial [Chitinispirillaceae bacterium]|nr:hypothetical protein [Chitinispirillaceae bacterium]